MRMMVAVALGNRNRPMMKPTSRAICSGFNRGVWFSSRYSTLYRRFKGAVLLERRQLSAC